MRHLLGLALFSFACAPPNFAGHEVDRFEAPPVSFLAFQGVSDETLWFAGASIARFQEGSWSVLQERLDIVLGADIAAVSHEEAFAVGESDAVARIRGTTIERVAVADFVGATVWANAADDVWLGGQSAGGLPDSNEILRWNGTQLVRVPVPDPAFSYLSAGGARTGEAFFIARAGGLFPIAAENPEYRLFRCEEAGCVAVLDSPPQHLGKLWVAASGEVWSIGNARGIARHHEGRWTVYPIEDEPRDISGSVERVFVLARAGNEDYAILRWTGSSWDTFDRIRGLVPDRIWVGPGGYPWVLFSKTDWLLVRYRS
jgi:hypothetical protein